MPSAPDLVLCSAQDVIDCFGGGQEALAIMNKWARGATTTFDQSTLTRPILTASARVAKACGNKYRLDYSADVTVYPQDIRTMTSIEAVYFFAMFQGQLQAIPEGLKLAISDNRTEMDKIATGKTGTSPQKMPGSRVTSYRADITRSGTVNRMTLRGWEIF